MVANACLAGEGPAAPHTRIDPAFTIYARAASSHRHRHGRAGGKHGHRP